MARPVSAPSASRRTSSFAGPVAASVEVSSSSATTLHQASREWASRPDDERFLSLLDLNGFVQATRRNSASKVVSSRRIEFAADPADEMKGLTVMGPGGNPFAPTHWSFGQLAALAGAPASYLRGLPAPMAADCMNYGMKFARDADDIGLLFRKPEANGMTPSGSNLAGVIGAATGPKYGRVWNSDITQALVDKFGDGRSGHWRIPGEFGKQVEITKANTTLYASDRDMFVFLADEEHRVHLPGRRGGNGLARGFFVWNSEVGSSTFGIAMFLFDYACSNRIVWGVEGHKEIRIRHTASAPDRYIESVVPAIKAYASASPKPIEDVLKAAAAAKVDDLTAFLDARKFTKSQQRGIISAHMEEEGRPMETLWDVTTGVTAYAKRNGHQDERVALERKGGDILDLAAKW